MKIYFLSCMPCALTLNGAYFGLTDTFERYAEIAFSDRIYAKFSPEGKLPIGFFITENLLTVPPLGCEVYLLADGIAVYAKDFPPADFTLRPVTQARFEIGTASVFFQGALQLSLETTKGFFISTLPPAFSVCRLSSHGNLFFIEGKNCLAVYTTAGECVFLENILSFSVHENVLNATLPLSDRLGRVAECCWDLQEDGLERTQFTLKQSRDNNGETDAEKIADELLAYAFFESILIGADYIGFLSDALIPQAQRITAFLGNFTSVALTKNPRVCGLIRKKAPRLFEIDYFTVETENGKITDVLSASPTAPTEFTR